MNILIDEMHSTCCKEASPSSTDTDRPGNGLSGIKNGQLLKLIEQQFEVFITTDKNLRHQQNLARLRLAFVLLPTNRVHVVITLIPKIEEALKTIQSGDFVEVAMP